MEGERGQQVLPVRSPFPRGTDAMPIGTASPGGDGSRLLVWRLYQPHQRRHTPPAWPRTSVVDVSLSLFPSLSLFLSLFTSLSFYLSFPIAFFFSRGNHNHLDTFFGECLSRLRCPLSLCVCVCVYCFLFSVFILSMTFPCRKVFWAPHYRVVWLGFCLPSGIHWSSWCPLTDPFVVVFHDTSLWEVSDRIWWLRSASKPSLLYE